MTGDPGEDDDDTLEEVLEKLDSRTRKRPILPSDEELTAGFVDREGDRTRYCQELGGYLTFTGSCYRRNQGLVVLDRAQEYCAEVAVTLRAKPLASRKRIDAVVHLARAREPIRTEVGEWDSDPDILCTPDGIVELPTGGLRKATPVDYCTRQTLVTPKGKCPRFLRTLKQIFLSNPSLIPFLQVFGGYSLTGHDRERKFVFAHGGGNNGKDLIFDLLRLLMGGYAGSIPTETLLASKYDRHPAEVALLKGLRLGVASETPRNRRWNESRVKLLTGAGAVSARFMGGNFFTFPMTAKLVVLGNEQPILTTQDEAWRERMCFMAFLEQFIGKRAKKGLKEDLLAAEGPGILQWFVEGAVIYYAEGLKVPAEVSAATDSYMREQDVRGRWIAECIDTTDAQAKTYVRDLFDSWKYWAEREHEYIGTPNALSRELNKRYPGARGEDEKSTFFRKLKVRR
jgi:putative DNA primase/helicase